LDNDQLMDNFEITNSTVGFGADEMVVCNKCERKIPPNRIECIYCGTKIDSAEIPLDSLKLNLKKPENFENGYNLIITKQEELQSSKLKSVSGLFGLDSELLRKIFETNEPLPCARLLSSDDSTVALRKLANLNVTAEIVSDETLKLKEPSQRLRGLKIDDDRIVLTLFNTGETIEILLDELVMVVIGSIFEKKIETVEKYSKIKESKIVSADETGHDEKVIDIYSKSNSIGYRIFTHGFDFSCLESEMSFLAVENIQKLFLKLGKIGSNVIAIDSYDRIRNLIGGVWEVEAVSDSRSVEKKGVGKFNRNRATKYSNLGQFTRYSRLKRHLL
jgi:hypothetical protein